VLVLVGGCFNEPPTLAESDGTSAGSSGPTESSSSEAETSHETTADAGTSTSAGDAMGTGAEVTTDVDTTGEETRSSGDGDTTGAEDSTGDGATETGRPRCTHHVFVTEERWAGVLGGLAGADEKCAAAAEATGAEGTWVAVLSSSETDARTRIAVVGPVCDNYGELVAHDAAQWWSSHHEKAIDVMDNGQILDPAGWRVWTASNPSGEFQGIDCGGWLDESGAGVTVGDAHRSDGWWISAQPMNIQQCGFFGRLYCFQSAS
jgi:hypothetical protein